ncbi:MAG: U32 family peptidase [Prevotellaceae bacterium]|jgi:putative protease|nr:U32 family peptidase [Prevotellaceae bacterium]
MYKKIELLSPAKDLATGIAAILHGADAVYIGASDFSARAAAGNSLEDIKKLVDFAHLYYAKIYITLNTILTDGELSEVQKLIWQLYLADVDALIIQDMGILELDLPGIELHASTQCDNRSVEKVQFLERCGFAQVVLARELSLQQIAEINQDTSVRLECFIHGALCVCYSGQCYMSQALGNRSANKGKCAQMCRQKYSLIDCKDNVIAQNAHLLSLKDFQASDYIENLIDVGITSFKIEGRLKNIDYVKNTTAFYRQKLDEIIESKGYKRASSGKTEFNFLPNIGKTFFRGATSYFLNQREKNIAEFRTPKSMGEKIGTVEKMFDNSILLKTNEKLNNSDGLCAFNKVGELIGFKVNRCENNMIFPHIMPKIEPNTEVFRNFDNNFAKLLENNSSKRKIAVKIYVSQEKNGLRFGITDEDNRNANYILETELIEGKNPQKLEDTYRESLSKLGNTIFETTEINFDLKKIWFVPVSKIVEARNMLIDMLLQTRAATFEKQNVKHQKTTHTFPEQYLDYHANIHNSKAKDFYVRHGVKSAQPAFEQQKPSPAELMRTKHCLKFSFGLCHKQKPQKKVVEPLYLVDNKQKFKLLFDCKNCEMVITKSL